MNEYKMEKSRDYLKINNDLNKNINFNLKRNNLIKNLNFNK